MLERQKEALERQLTLHKRMLLLMDKGAVVGGNGESNESGVGLVAEKTKKMKEILGIQKKVNGLTLEIFKEVNPELERLEKDVKNLVKEMEKAAAKAATEIAGNGGMNDVDGNPIRSFQLDKRSTVLRVEGLGKDTVLEDLKVQFSMQGVITDVKWIIHEVDRVEEEGASSMTNDTLKPTLLVYCSNRGVAERVRAHCQQYNGIDLTFAWHYDTTKKAPLSSSSVVGRCPSLTLGVGADALDDVATTENSAVEVDGGGKGDKSLYWTEDDDLMVDYDDEEDEES